MAKYQFVYLKNKKRAKCSLFLIAYASIYCYNKVYSDKRAKEFTMKELKLQDFYEYKFLSGLNFSPDKKQAAFVVHNANVAANDYDSFLYLMLCLIRIADSFLSYRKAFF